MTIKLYGSPQSPYVKLLAVVAAQAGIPYELVPVNYDDLRSDTHTAKQPFRQVPYIDDDGFILYESRAIARYLAAKAPDSGLLPPANDIKASAIFEQAASVEASNFAPSALEVIMQKIVRPYRNLPVEENRVDEAVTTLASKLEGYERILSKQRYMAGDTLTLVDMLYLPGGAVLADTGITLLSDKSKFPSVARWWKEITSLPSWQACKDGIKTGA